MKYTFTCFVLLINVLAHGQIDSTVSEQDLHKKSVQVPGDFLNDTNSIEERVDEIAQYGDGAFDLLSTLNRIFKAEYLLGW